MKHPPGEIGLCRCLILNVNEKVGVLSTKLYFHQQVYFVLVAGGNIRKDFLVQWNNFNLAVQILPHLRQKEFDELNEKGRNQLLEKTVVIGEHKREFTLISGWIQ